MQIHANFGYFSSRLRFQLPDSQANPALSLPPLPPRPLLIQGRDEFVMLAEQPRTGLSANPERYLAKGLRAPTKIKGFFLAGGDLTISGMEGSVMGG